MIPSSGSRPDTERRWNGLCLENRVNGELVFMVIRRSDHPRHESRAVLRIVSELSQTSRKQRKTS